MTLEHGTDPTPADPAVGDLTSRLSGRRVGFVVANEGVEQVELTAPWETVEHNGGRPVLIATRPDPVVAFRHLDAGDQFQPDLTTADAGVDSFDAIVLPGGVANADELRTDEHAVRFVREFWASGRPVAAICHAPWTLIEAGVLDGKRMTSWPSLRTDLTNAGAEWVDEELVEDGQLITSRKPADLAAFCDALLHRLERASG